MGDLKGRSALITGSVGGLGLATARALASQGCNIMLNGFADPHAVTQARNELQSTCSVEVSYHAADLRKVEQIERLVADTHARFGSLDILVNNAVVRHPGALADYKVDDWNEALAVNLSAPFHAIRLALPGMRRRGWGRIVNISSTLGLVGRPNHVDYVTTKTGLIGLTRAVAVEVAKEGITCNAVCPGTMLTPPMVALIGDLARAENTSYEQAKERYLALRMPSGRFVEEQSVADLIVFLCGPGGKDVNGAALPIDGAWTAV